MRRSLMAALAALGVVAAAAPSVSADETASAAKLKYCGKVEIGFTRAKVMARGAKCKKARSVIRRFAKQDCPTPEPCFAKQIGHWGCAQVPGSELVVKVRCGNPEGDLVRGVWGD